MKCLAIFLFVGLATALPGYGPFGPGGLRSLWRPGTEYTLAYEGRMLTGIPELASHYSGLGLNATLTLRVQPDGSSFELRVRQPKYARVNQYLPVGNGQLEGNWRKVPLPQFQPVGQQAAQWLEEPTRFTLNAGGEFEELVVGREQPEWCVNFKKALVALFQTKLENGMPDIETNNVVPSGSEGEQGLLSTGGFWKNQEESVDGICEVTYELNQLPEYFVQQNPELFPLKEKCGGSNGGSGNAKYYELVKTRDLNSCVKRNSFTYYKPGFFRCPTDGGANCDGMYARSSIVRYYACGAPNGGNGGNGPRISVQRIVNEGELQQAVLGVRTEKVTTGTRQVIRVVDERPISGGNGYEGIRSGPASPVSLKSLCYEYSLKGGKKESGFGGEQVLTQMDIEGGEPSVYEKTVPRHILGSGPSGSGSGYGPSGNDKQQVISQMEKLFQQIVEDLTSSSVSSVANRQVPSKVLTLARGFTILNRNEIEQLYQNIQQQILNGGSGSGEEGSLNSKSIRKDLLKGIFYETLIMGGSYENIVYIKEKALRGDEIPEEKLAAIFSFLPQYVIAPTRNVLEQLRELVQSNKIQQNPRLEGYAIMGYTTLLQRACLDENRFSSYPTHVFGNFCHPHSEILTAKWIPHLINKLEGTQKLEKKQLYLVTLGLLSHKQVIPTLLRYVEGLPGTGVSRKDSQPKAMKELTRQIAVSSLINAGFYHKKWVLPILSNVYISQGEIPQVRLAALDAIFKLDPPMAVLHKIVASTWVERNPQMLHYVNTAIYSLSQMENGKIDPAWNVKASLSQKAAVVYPLLKKATTTRIPTSGTSFLASMMPELGIGYRGMFTWLSDYARENSPVNVYANVKYYMDRYQFTPIEMGIRTSNPENGIRQIVQLIAPGASGFGGGRRSEMHSEMKKILEKIDPEGILGGKGGNGNKPFSGAMYLRLMDNVHMFSNLHSESADVLSQKIAEVLSNSKALKKIIAGEAISYQKVINLAPVERSIPSDMGLPIVSEVHMPIVVSMQGRIKTNGLRELIKPKAEVAIKTVIAGQVIGWVGTQCPFTNEFVYTGIDEHSALNIPGQIDITFEPKQGKFSIDIKPGQDQSGSQGKTDLYHFHVRPFTSRMAVNELTPITLSKHFKLINTRFMQGKATNNDDSPANVQTFKVGQYLGLDLKAVWKTQENFIDYPMLVEKLRFYNYNPINVLGFFWASTAISEQGKPSLRMHEFQLQYNPSGSTTKEAILSVDVNCGSLKEGGDIRHHIFEESNGYGYGSTYLPYKISSKGSGEIGEKTEGQSMVEEALKKIGEGEGEGSGSGSGTGFSVIASLILKGNQQERVFKYTMQAASGLRGLKQTWHMKLGSNNSQKKICVDGKFLIPKDVPRFDIQALRNSDISFKYDNVIGFGNGCESKVIVSGETSTSQKQKEYSEQSPEAIVYKRMKEQNVPLHEVSQTAEKVRAQASALDKVVFSVKYVNYPKEYLYIPNAITEYTKAILAPYRQMNTTYSPNAQKLSGLQGERVNFETEQRLRFNQYGQSFNLTLVRPTETVKFQHVVLPGPLRYIVPVSSRYTNEIVNGGRLPILDGDRLSCYLSKNWMKTFTGRNITVQPTGEWTHLACNHGQGRSHLVSSRTQSSTGRKEVLIYLESVKLTIKPEGPEGKISVHVESGNMKPQPNGQGYYVRDNSGERVATVTLTDAGKGCVVTPVAGFDFSVTLTSGARIVEIFEQNPMSSLFGKCAGKGPHKGNNEEYSAKVWGGHYRQTGGFCQRPYQVTESAGNHICFAKQRRDECARGCTDAGQGVITGRVAFACLPRTPFWEQKQREAQQGKFIAEVVEKPTAYTKNVNSPRQCKRA